QHLSVRTPRCRIDCSPGDKGVSGGRPGAADRIVKFRARAGIESTRDEHLTVRQQRRRVSKSPGDEATGGRPSAADRIVELRAPEIALVNTARDKHPPGGEKRPC